MWINLAVWGGVLAAVLVPVWVAAGSEYLAYRDVAQQETLAAQVRLFDTGARSAAPLPGEAIGPVPGAGEHDRLAGPVDQVSGVLDVEDVIKEQYQLEVSSPGLDRPLYTLEHFERFAGHKVKLTLVSPIEGQRKFKGTLQGVEDGQVIVNIGDNELVLSLNAIDKANLVPEF